MTPKPKTNPDAPTAPEAPTGEPQPAAQPKARRERRTPAQQAQDNVTAAEKRHNAARAAVDKAQLALEAALAQIDPTARALDYARANPALPATPSADQ